MVSATLTCDDATAMATVKAVGEKSLAALKDKVSVAPKIKLPDDVAKYVKAAATTTRRLLQTFTNRAPRVDASQTRGVQPLRDAVLAEPGQLAAVSARTAGMANAINSAAQREIMSRQ